MIDFIPVIGNAIKTSANKINIDIIKNSPSLMNFPQRMVLFSLVLGTVPRSYLELGTAMGGSATIVSHAIDILGVEDFKGVAIDLTFDMMAPETRDYIGDKFTYIKNSVGIESLQAASRISRKFDIVLIDALHDRANAIFDFMTIYPYVEKGGYILFDDANYFGVSDALKEAVELTGAIDCGMLSRHGGVSTPENPPAWVNPDERALAATEAVWGGLYMLRKPC